VTGREHGLIECIDITNAKDRTTPPGRSIARREGQIDESITSLEGTEARLRPTIDQREAEGPIERNGFRHGSYCEGRSTDMVDQRLPLPCLHARPDLGGHRLHLLQHLLEGTAYARKIYHEISYPQSLILSDVQGDLGRRADKRGAVARCTCRHMA